MTTVILLNPMGTDVTAFVPTLLQGTILEPGDTLYTLPYLNDPGSTNIAGGVTLLDDKLNETSGDILVFGYSEGCQIAYKWLRDHGVASPITPTTRLTFLLIGNAERKFGGFVYGHDVFDDVADTLGLPAVVPYQVTDFCRQYDGTADFPTAQPIQDALVGLESVETDLTVFPDAMRAVAAVLNNTSQWEAAMNALSGILLVHNNYFDVTVDDPANLSYTEVTSPNVTYVWAPTYPTPLLGVSTLFSDQAYRTQIEQSYARPVTIPMPDYVGGVATWSKPSPVVGWWPEPVT